MHSRFAFGRLEFEIRMAGLEFGIGIRFRDGDVTLELKIFQNKSRSYLENYNDDFSKKKKKSTLNVFT